MSNYELKKHKKSDKIKWILTFTAIILLAVMVTGMGLQLFGQGKVKPSEWFKPTEQETPLTPEENPAEASRFFFTITTAA